MPGRAQGWTCPLVLHAAINVWFLILDLKSPLPLSIERYPHFPESNAWGFTHNLTGDYELGLSQTQKVIHLQGCCAVQPGHKASRCYPRDTLGPCPPACSSGAPRQNSAMNIRWKVKVWVGKCVVCHTSQAVCFFSELTDFVFPNWQHTRFPEIPENRALAVFFEHLLFPHWEMLVRSHFRESAHRWQVPPHLPSPDLSLTQNSGKLPPPRLALCMSPPSTSLGLTRPTERWHSLPNSCLF